MRWFQHLEAATHQSRSARDVLRNVPLLSILVLRLIQDDGIRGGQKTKEPDTIYVFFFNVEVGSVDD